MKKIMLTVAIALMATVGFAQDAAKDNVDERIQQRVDVMTEQLDLTEAQQKQLHQLYKEESAKRKAASSAQAVRANKKQQMDEKQNAYKKKLKAILTPEQYEKWQNAKHKNKSKKTRY